MRKTLYGFTLIEIMLTVAIIGLLAAIAIPKFGDMINRAHEAATRGSTGSVRSAIDIYYADNEGIYPGPNLYAALLPKYLLEFPSARLPMHGHAAGRGVSNASLGIFFDWPGGPGNYLPWAFIEADPSPGAPRGRGELFIFCNHPDSRGVKWSDY